MRLDAVAPSSLIFPTGQLYSRSEADPKNAGSSSFGRPLLRALRRLLLLGSACFSLWFSLVLFGSSSSLGSATFSFLFFFLFFLRLLLVLVLLVLRLLLLLLVLLHFFLLRFVVGSFFFLCIGSFTVLLFLCSAVLLRKFM